MVSIIMPFPFLGWFYWWWLVVGFFVGLLVGWLVLCLFWVEWVGLLAFTPGKHTFFKPFS